MSIGMDLGISEFCYKGTILWSFSYNSFVNFNTKKNLGNYMTVLHPNPCYNEDSTVVYILMTNFHEILVLITHA